MWNQLRTNCVEPFWHFCGSFHLFWEIYCFRQKTSISPTQFQPGDWCQQIIDCQKTHFSWLQTTQLHLHLHVLSSVSLFHLPVVLSISDLLDLIERGTPAPRPANVRRERQGEVTLLFAAPPLTRLMMMDCGVMGHSGYGRGFLCSASSSARDY